MVETQCLRLIPESFKMELFKTELFKMRRKHCVSTHTIKYLNVFALIYIIALRPFLIFNF